MHKDILALDDSVYYDNYRRDKVSILGEYKSSMDLYLSKMRPDVDPTKRKNILDKICKNHYTPHKLTYVKAESPCNLVKKTDDLLSVMNKFDQGILSPCGVAYNSVNVSESPFTGFIKTKQSNRKIYKKKQFEAECSNDEETEFIMFRQQFKTKLDINIISGVLTSTVSFHSAFNYNAITSTARFGIRTTFAVTELALGSNYFFYSEQMAINWIVNLLKVLPHKVLINRCISRYNLMVPSCEYVQRVYKEQVCNYDAFSSCSKLFQLISTLSTEELTFIYYALNMRRLFFDNEYFKTFFKELIHIDDNIDISNMTNEKLNLPDEILMIMTIVFLTDDIGNNTLDQISENIELVKKIQSVYNKCEEKLSDLELLFNTFILVPVAISDIDLHRNMRRKIVMLSDTDSILFSTVSHIKWLTGGTIVNTDSIRFNAVIVALLGKLLDHTFSYMSAALNVDAVNMKILRVKNEFFYPIFMRTPISKHYAAYAMFKEGVRQNPFKLDIKGKNFIGSDLSTDITAFIVYFIRHIFDTFLSIQKLDPKDLILKVIAVEQKIKSSIIDLGETTYLKQSPINRKDKYANPMSSSYFYYELWQSVFAHKYDNLSLPQKTKEVPIAPLSIKRLHVIEYMKEIDNVVYNKLVDFLKQFPNKKIIRILIPVDNEIPKELLPIIDFRKVCAINCYALKTLILGALNITIQKNKSEFELLSDMYPELLGEAIKEIVNIEIDETDETIQQDIDEDQDDDEEEYLDEFETVDE